MSCAVSVKETGRVSMEREIFKKGHGQVCPGDSLRCSRWIHMPEGNRTAYPVATMGRLQGVSPHSFYAWHDPRPSARTVANERLPVPNLPEVEVATDTR